MGTGSHTHSEWAGPRVISPTIFQLVPIHPGVLIFFIFLFYTYLFICVVVCVFVNLGECGMLYMWRSEDNL